MKYKNRIAFLFISFCIGLNIISCDDNIPTYEDVKVESIQINDELKQGVSFEIDATEINVAGQVTVLPEDATNKMESFSSSNPEVAEVDERGDVTLKSIGSTTITITVDGKSDDFVLTVTEKKQIRVAEIQVVSRDIEIMIGLSRDIASLVNVLPVDAANKTLLFESDDELIVRVDADGIITGLKVGSATITITSEDVPTISEEINVTVTEFKGDYPRADWSMSISQTLFVEGSNSLTSAIDGDAETFFGLVKPSKSWKGVSVPGASNGGYIYFIVDMKSPQAVNYFRVRHRNTTQVFLRYMMIEEISGSNDGENFTTIASDVEITDARTDEVIESPNISIPKSNYRYLKFYCQKDACFFSMSQGSTVQLSELYLGVE